MRARLGVDTVDEHERAPLGPLRVVYHLFAHNSLNTNGAYCHCQATVRARNVDVLPSSLGLGTRS